MKKFAGAAAACWALSACGGGTNLYAGPRTVPPGVVSHSLALDATVLRQGSSTVAVAPSTLPTYGLRVGLAPRVDLGFRLASIFSPGVDAKAQLLRTPFVDVAVDPGVEVIPYAIVPSWFVDLGLTARADLPLVMGVNLTDRVTAILAPGMVYQWGDTTPVECIDAVAAASQLEKGWCMGRGEGFTPVSHHSAPAGWWQRLGLAVRVEVGADRGVALQPEVTVLRSTGREEAFLISAGLGVSFRAKRAEGPSASSN
jgi:hypothetical protein